MQTKVQNMQNFQGYTKCGEILKPPTDSYQRPYVLKCFLCKEIYLLFEAFIFHFEDHCKNANAGDESHTNDKGISDILPVSNNIEEHMEVGEQIEETNVNVKVEENNCAMQTVRFCLMWFGGKSFILGFQELIYN